MKRDGDGVFGSQLVMGGEQRTNASRLLSDILGEFVPSNIIACNKIWIVQCLLNCLRQTSTSFSGLISRGRFIHSNHKRTITYFFKVWN